MLYCDTQYISWHFKICTKALNLSAFFTIYSLEVLIFFFWRGGGCMQKERKYDQVKFIINFNDF